GAAIDVEDGEILSLVLAGLDRARAGRDRDVAGFCVANLPVVRRRRADARAQARARHQGHCQFPHEIAPLLCYRARYLASIALRRRCAVSCAHLPSSYFGGAESADSKSARACAMSPFFS